MNLSWRHLASAIALPAIFATACATTTDSASSSEDELNYRSTAGQEFLLTTDVTFKVSADIKALEGDAKATALAKKADDVKNTVTTAITAKLDELWPEDQRTTRAGLAIEFRETTATQNGLKAAPDGLSYTMTVAAEFAGVNDLLKKLPLTTEGDRTFLAVSATVDDGAQPLKVFLSPIERSLNAYPKYMALFEDGLDIAVHVGGDHDVPPQDIDHARSVYDDLLASGFKSPVAKFEDLKLDTPPLTSTISVAGKPVAVRVKIIDVDMSTPDTRQVLIDAYKASVKNADIIIYDGHAGRQLDYSGVVVAYVPARVALPASEFKNIDATDKQQVYLFNGCETYTGYADSLYQNPKKNTSNTDIITTGNFSAIQAKANQVISFIHSFIDQKNGAWIPKSWDSVLGKMNAVGERSWVHVYGVHGIDDNPKLSPLADASKLGKACATDAECGAPDSKCLAVTAQSKVCGLACADTAGCPNGTRCVLPKGKTSADDLQCSSH